MWWSNFSSFCQSTGVDEDRFQLDTVFESNIIHVNDVLQNDWVEIMWVIDTLI